MDRLVDGELSEAQQQEVLQQLQRHPDGWRRLALAFLEAQTWRREMPRLLEESLRPKDQKEESFCPDKPALPAPAQVHKYHGQTEPAPTRQGQTHHEQTWQVQIQRPVRFHPTDTPTNFSQQTWQVQIHRPVLRPGLSRPIRSLAWQIFALAVGMLIAFLGGYWSRDFRHTLQDGSLQTEVVQGTPFTTQEPRQPKSPSEKGRGKEGQDFPGRLPSSGWEYITLAAGTGPDGIPEVVRIPVLPAASQPGLPPIQPPIPEELLDLLRRWGAEVSHSRQLVPLRIQDGRQVVIPVEQVELYYRPQAERFQ